MQSLLFLPPYSVMGASLRSVVDMGAELAAAGYPVWFVLPREPQHCTWLSELPEAVPCLIRREGAFVPCAASSLPEAPSSSDIWVLPDGVPDVLESALSCGVRVLFYARNWGRLLAELPENVDLNAPSLHFLAASRPEAWAIRQLTGQDVEMLRPGLNHGLFHRLTTACASVSEDKSRDNAVSPRIAWIPGKRRELVAEIQALVALRAGQRGSVAPEWVEIRDNSPEERARILRGADIFFASEFPHAFPLAPLEAMASGCVVTGFSAFGGWDYMRQPVELYAGRARGETPVWLPQPLRNVLRKDERPGNGLWAADGDVIGAVFALDKILYLWEEQGDGWDALIGGSSDTAALYTAEAFRSRLLALWEAAAQGKIFA